MYAVFWNNFRFMLFPKYRIGYAAPELTYVNGAPEEHSTLSARAQTLTQTQTHARMEVPH